MEETCDPSKCLEIIPKHLGFERSMLERLVNRSDDYIGAFKSLPQSLQILMIHSLQSLAFNHALKSRLSNSMQITSPHVGDIVAPLSENGRTDVGKAALVSEWNLDRCSKNASRGRISITGILPGNNVMIAEGEAGRHESEGVKSAGLEDIEWMVQRFLDSQQMELVDLLLCLLPTSVWKKPPQSLMMISQIDGIKDQEKEIVGIQMGLA